MLLTAAQGLAINLYSSFWTGTSDAGWKVPLAITGVTTSLLCLLLYIPSVEDKQLAAFKLERDEQLALARTYQDDITRQKIEYNRATAEARIKAVQAGNFHDVEKLDQLRSNANG